MVVRTEPPLTHEQFVAFKGLIETRGHREPTYAERDGAIVITDPWPFELKKNMDELEATVRAAVETVKRQ
jgi:hypothetical protein